MPNPNAITLDREVRQCVENYCAVDAEHTVRSVVREAVNQWLETTGRSRMEAIVEQSREKNRQYLKPPVVINMPRAIAANQ